MLRTVHDFKIDPASLHSCPAKSRLANAGTGELVHFWTAHANTMFTFQGQTWPGAVLREHIRDTMYEKLSGEHAPYNLRFVTNRISSTTTSVAAAALGIRELDSLTEQNIDDIRQVHLLLVMYNALQPGVFALSGWDLVGALPLPFAEVEERMGDGDTRWIQRGAYDLADADPNATSSSDVLPKARCLYGSIVSQLRDEKSFASQLSRILRVSSS